MKILAVHQYTEYKGCWFRVFGFGLSISNEKPRFSEREGVASPLRILGWKLELLHPFTH